MVESPVFGVSGISSSGTFVFVSSLVMTISSVLSSTYSNRILISSLLLSYPSSAFVSVRMYSVVSFSFPFL